MSYLENKVIEFIGHNEKDVAMSILKDPAVKFENPQDAQDAVMLAADMNMLDVIVELVDKKGVDLKDMPSDLLSKFVISQDYPGMRYLLKSGIDIERQAPQAIRIASGNNFVPGLRIMVEAGVNVAAPLEKDAQLSSNLAWAAQWGALDSVEYLIRMEADIHEQNDFATVNACYYGQKNTLALLLENGGDINGRDGELLSLCAGQDNPDSLALALENGADIAKYGDKALEAAVMLCQPNAAIWLIDNGVDPKNVPAEAVLSLIENNFDDGKLRKELESRGVDCESIAQKERENSIKRGR